MLCISSRNSLNNCSCPLSHDRDTSGIPCTDLFVREPDFKCASFRMFLNGVILLAKSGILFPSTVGSARIRTAPLRFVGDAVSAGRSSFVDKTDTRLRR